MIKIIIMTIIEVLGLNNTGVMPDNLQLNYLDIQIFRNGY